MASVNPFDLLGDDDNEDPSLLIAAQQQKLSQLQPKQKSSAATPAAQPAKAAKLPSKPLPPAQAVREANSDSGRGGRGGGRGFGRGGGRGGFNRELANGESNGFSGGYRPFKSDSGREDSARSFEKRGFGGPRVSGRGGRSGGSTDGDDVDGDRPPRRMYERRSGTGRGSEFKRDGAGRGNWGSAADEIPPVTEDPVSEAVKNVTEKQLQDENADANKVVLANEEEKEQEEKEMTLEEYEKVIEEKRKALVSLKIEERKVELDKDLETMQALSNKKANDNVFIKLGSEKDKRRDVLEKDEKAKKSVNINTFLKPAEGDRYYRGGRGRGGRDRGSRGGYAGSHVPAPSIEDRQHFPSLGGK